MLPKRLRRVSRAGGGYHPQLVGDDETAREVAGRTIGVFQGHVGEPRGALDEALTDLERSLGDADGVGGGPDAYKLVRGFAHLLERAATFETQAPLPPARARRAAFEAAERVGVTDEHSRRQALQAAGEQLGVAADAVDRSLYADRETRQVLVRFAADWDPAELCRQYDFALAASALLDATEVRVRASDPKRVVSAAGRAGLIYEVASPADVAGSGRNDAGAADDEEASGIEPVAFGTDEEGDPTRSERTLVLTGPDAIFRRTRRYGTAFASLLETLVRHVPSWELRATIDDRGTDRELRLTDADVPAPGPEPSGEPAFDSGVERDFARRFRALDLDWRLTREPEPLRVTSDGTARVMIPDFAFEYDHAPFRLFFEVMGFWTPEYVTSKLDQLAGLEDVDTLVAVDASLGVGEEIETRDHRVIEYDGTVRVKDVVDVLREYEAELRGAATAGLPDTLRPTEDVVSVETVADRHGVPVEAIDDVETPDHERVGGQLIRPRTLNELGASLEDGMSYETATDRLAEAGVTEPSAVIDAVGYRVAWNGLTGGTLRRAE